MKHTFLLSAVFSPGSTHRSREALPDGLAQFLGIKIGQTAVEKQHLPEPFLQMNEGFRSSASLLDATGRRAQRFENALTYDSAGAGYQDLAGIVRRDR
jgi:hypothetical protein